VSKENWSALLVGLLFGGIAGYLFGAWHLMWANASLTDENRGLWAELRTWRKGWVPRGFVIPVRDRDHDGSKP
jgi:hypothetical protein